MGYWMVWKDPAKAGWVEIPGADKEAHIKKATELVGKAPDEVFTLPYPASPIIFRDYEKLPEGHTFCPPFCSALPQCMNRSSCPKSHACDD